MSKRILVAYDGSAPAKRALSFAIEQARLAKAQLGVVSVVPVHAGRIGIDPWDDRKVHSKELLEAKEIVMEGGLTPNLHEPYGEIADEIVRTAKEGGYDQIVTGSQHKGLLERALQGSISEAVAVKSAATVTIVH